MKLHRTIKLIRSEKIVLRIKEKDQPSIIETDEKTGPWIGEKDQPPAIMGDFRVNPNEFINPDHIDMLRSHHLVCELQSINSRDV